MLHIHSYKLGRLFVNQKFRTHTFLNSFFYSYLYDVNESRYPHALMKQAGFTEDLHKNFFSFFLNYECKATLVQSENKYGIMGEYKRSCSKLWNNLH